MNDEFYENKAASDIIWELQEYEEIKLELDSIIWNAKSSKEYFNKVKELMTECESLEEASLYDRYKIKPNKYKAFLKSAKKVKAIIKINNL